MKREVLYRMCLKYDGEIDMLNFYRYKDKKKAIKMRNFLNAGLRDKGYNDMKYLVAKVITEYIK